MTAPAAGGGELAEIPLSALEHYAYCHRQTALIHAEGAWGDSAETVRGDLSHRLVDLPGLTRRAGLTIVRSLPVASHAHGLRGRARVAGPTSGNPLLRQAQHRASESREQRIVIATAMVAGKIHNSRQVLLRAARDTTGHRQVALRATAELVAQRLDLLRTAESIDGVLGIEGITARDYFAALPYLVTDNKWQAGGRSKRPPTDPVNCLLSFLYGMLRVAVHGALEQVGLDPYIGFLHGIRPGKPALALDLMEEFRPLLADRLAFTLLNRRELAANDFEKLPNGACRLTDDGRKTTLNAWQANRRRPWPHAQLRNDVEGAVLPLVQARLLARYLRGDLDVYRPWTVN